MESDSAKKMMYQSNYSHTSVANLNKVYRKEQMTHIENKNYTSPMLNSISKPVSR